MYEYEPKNGSVVTPDKLGAFFAKYKLDSEPFPFAGMFLVDRLKKRTKTRGS